jgi:hypothetical protein
MASLVVQSLVSQSEWIIEIHIVDPGHHRPVFGFKLSPKAGQEANIMKDECDNPPLRSNMGGE